MKILPITPPVYPTRGNAHSSVLIAIRPNCEEHAIGRPARPTVRTALERRGAERDPRAGGAGKPFRDKGIVRARACARETGYFRRPFDASPFASFPCHRAGGHAGRDLRRMDPDRIARPQRAGLGHRAGFPSEDHPHLVKPRQHHGLHPIPQAQGRWQLGFEHRQPGGVFHAVRGQQRGAEHQLRVQDRAQHLQPGPGIRVRERRHRGGHGGSPRKADPDRGQHLQHLAGHAASATRVRPGGRWLEGDPPRREPHRTGHGGEKPDHRGLQRRSLGRQGRAAGGPRAGAIQRQPRTRRPWRPLRRMAGRRVLRRDERQLDGQHGEHRWSLRSAQRQLHRRRQVRSVGDPIDGGTGRGPDRPRQPAGLRPDGDHAVEHLPHQAPRLEAQADHRPGTRVGRRQLHRVWRCVRPGGMARVRTPGAARQRNGHRLFHLHVGGQLFVELWLRRWLVGQRQWHRQHGPVRQQQPAGHLHHPLRKLLRRFRLRQQLPSRGTGQRHHAHQLLERLPQLVLPPHGPG